MKTLATTALLLFITMLACAMPGLAQNKQRGTIKPAQKPATTAVPAQPAPSPAMTAAKTNGPEQTGPIQGKVIDIGWGDSLTVLDAQSKQHRVRLLGIDAPEKEQAFGPAAHQKLSALVFGKTVTIKYQKMDRSNRPLGKVLLGTTDINLEMLKAGLAWYYANDSDLPPGDRPLYAGAEREARSAGRGLWQDESPQPPWEFRQARKKQQQQTVAIGAPGTPGAEESGSEPAQVATEVAPDKNSVGDKESDIPSEQTDASTFPKPPKQNVTGDRTTRTYFKNGCPEVEKVSPEHRVFFGSIEEAERAGFKRTPNCP
jgi:endonuclease YncB( thermonuclease family)